MKLERTTVALGERADKLKHALRNGARLGLISSIDGSQLITLVLYPDSKSAQLWNTPLSGEDTYSSLTPMIPQCHWFERTAWDLFGLMPKGHPRLKHNLLHEPYHEDLLPLRAVAVNQQGPHGHRAYRHLEVKGEGLYEIPVGPIHAGIIEPGHFRFSCLGEVIVNLEIRLGYVHRGVEKRLTEVPWQKARFVAEAAASDMAAANALAHAVALESVFDVELPDRAQALRTLSLEIERVAIHIADLGGIAGDIGYLAIAASMARLRGNALRLGELLTGTRFQRGFICPGGIFNDPGDGCITEIRNKAQELKLDLAAVFKILLKNQAACERMVRIGRVSKELAKDFGFVGIAGRACGINYDARRYFQHGVYPEKEVALPSETEGDVFSRAKVRIFEVQTSLQLIEEICATVPSGPVSVDLPRELPPDSTGLGIVESHRGELIHLVFTDENGKISRYAIKDASFNNWTALAIAIRNNLVADFPLCNKSFSLSYSGHDL